MRVDLDRELQIERELARERARSSLLGFITYTKHDFELSWHHKTMCRYMDDFIADKFDRLIITAPPRHTKSEIVSRRLPAFILGRDPNAQIISASYGAKLAQRMNRDVQRIITTAEYRELFPGTALNEKNSRTLADGSWLRNSEMFEVVGHKGYYLCAGIGGSLVGSGADVALIDDPVKSWKEAYSPTFRQNVWEWYTSVLYTRLSKVGRICLTLTRWHEDDLAGRLLELMKSDPESDRWVHINLPAIKEDPPSEDDPREIGEALWPARYPLKKLEKIRRNSEAVFTANYQNRPAPVDGNVVKRHWWKFYTSLPENIDLWAVSMDGTFKDKEKSDFCVLQVWARSGANKYLVHQIRARMPYVAQRQALRDLRRMFPQVTAWWLEDSALSSALKSDLGGEIPGLILVPAQGSKMMRADGVSPQIEAGNVFLPANKPLGQGAPEPLGWVEQYITEWALFPNAANDDQVDATSMALARLGQAMSWDWLPQGVGKESAWAGV